VELLLLPGTCAGGRSCAGICTGAPHLTPLVPPYAPRLTPLVPSFTPRLTPLHAYGLSLSIGYWQ
jgi:hypothetical protein